MQDYLNVIKNHYADFKGRARRREYWMFVLFNAIISFVLGAVDGVLGFALGDNSAGVGILSGLYTLLVFLPSLAVGIRRLHDTGRSGWWTLVILVPIIGFFALIYFYVQDSQASANKWGSNPKGQGANLPQNAATNW